MTSASDLSNHTVSLGYIIELVQLGVSLILVPSAFMLVRRLGSIRDHLAMINGNVKEINQWRVDHDKRVEDEDHHHEKMHENCAALHQERLQNILQQLAQLWGRVGDRRGFQGPTD
jgi:ABC-type nickel/cobalt efflux system permease component RcnA